LIKQQLITNEEHRGLIANTTHGKPQYNTVKGNVQRIELHRGCPWADVHEYCYEPLEVTDFPIPEITMNQVQILDMNFLANPLWKDILFKIPKSRYEMVCGFDYRRLTLEACKMFKAKGFHTIRWAWDFELEQQRIHNKIWKMWLKAGFKNEDLGVFMICNWKIPHSECCKKLDLLKVWNVAVYDCWFDGQVSPNIKPVYWTEEQIKDFRGKKDSKCREHNQMVRFKILPELK